MVLSTGELPMTAKIAEDRGRRAHAGQQVRLLDIPADAGCGFGSFNYGADSGDAGPIAKAIKRAAGEHYGTAGPAFVQRLLEEGLDEIAQCVREIVDAFSHEHVPAGADGQVQRAAARLALIGAAGELATDWGITAWQPGEAFDAAARALADWIATRGGLISAEITAALAQVRRFFEAHGDSRFEPLDPTEEVRLVINRAGWRRGIGEEREWYVPSETWKAEVCVGLNPKATARMLADLGVLQRAPDGFQVVKKIHGHAMRVYVVTAAILDGGTP
jgi:putative DNA primase/helicase